MEVAVPLWLSRLSSLDDDQIGATVRQWANDAADVVAHQGDTLLYGGGKCEAARVFNGLARGLAALATCPGGVVFLGNLWCLRHFPNGHGYFGQVCQQCLNDPDGVSPEGQLPALRAQYSKIETLATQDGIL